MNVRNGLKLSNSDSDLFINQRSQSSFSGVSAIELSENNFSSLFAGADNEQAVNNFNFCTENLLTGCVSWRNTKKKRIIIRQGLTPLLLFEDAGKHCRATLSVQERYKHY